ncbi:pyridoxal phosphate-dependent aminotransferase [Haladaptatus sp. T7]|uniref:pyridoxal phosphate-dependent aminotransferase n=1 Tax=Haladaptatus sp. T7 TaxID=2029368 RepID=UPI00222FFE40|nr:pyridoxal phosphate-dependent aminotransferase [Haladaptatus sp. T7]
MEPRDLSAHVAYQAGRGIEEVARELGIDPDDLVKLASNENPFGPSPAAVDAIRDAAGNASTYPKASHTDLTARLADRWNVESEQVWLANGGDGALDYLSRALLDPGDTVLVPSPGFAYYGMSARYHHGEVNEYRLSAEDGFPLTADTVLSQYDGERIVYLTSPHNPSGGRFSLDAVTKIADETDEETLVLVDEAYGEYADGPSAISLLAERDDSDTSAGVSGNRAPRDDSDAPTGASGNRAPRDDVAVLRTFSKAYGLAGVRLGYAVVPEEWADAYARVNTPFAASELACRGGLAALTDDEHVEKSIETARWAREYIYETLDAPTWESHGNFVLAEVGDASAVAEAVQERGVILRDCTSFGLPDCVRITCGTKDETRRAVRELNEVLSS